MGLIMKTELNNDVLINRKILGWEWYKDITTYKLFTHLIYKANYVDDEHRGTIVLRGQVYTGLDKLAFETGLSLQNIKTSLKKLILTSNITSKSTNKYRIITVLKYNDYQLTNKQTNTQSNFQSTSNLTASKEYKELLKELKEVKKELNTIKKSKPKKIFTKPTIIEIEEYCNERNNNVNAEHFLDHYKSNGWLVGKNKMKDWKATIRTWEKNNYNNNNKPEVKVGNKYADDEVVY